MELAYKRTLTAVFVCCLALLAPLTYGQESGNVLINTDPQGSLVRLTGELSLSGVSPVKFDRLLSGQYEIRVIRQGFEEYHSVAYFSEAQASQLDIKLVPKTKTKAFLRSLIIPGWGQRYYGNKNKSALFAIGMAASVVGYYFVKDDYDSKFDDYTARKEAYESATLWSDLPGLQAAMNDAQKRANDAEDKVNIMAAAVIGIYAINLLDSFLFFPEFDRYTEYKAITAHPALDGDKVGVSLSVRF